MVEKLRMDQWVTAKVVDPHHLLLKEPIETPPGSTVSITMVPAQTVVQDQALSKRSIQGLQAVYGENEPGYSLVPPGESAFPGPSEEGPVLDPLTPEENQSAILPAGQPELRIFALGSTRVYRGAHGIPLSNWK